MCWNEEFAARYAEAYATLLDACCPPPRVLKREEFDEALAVANEMLRKLGVASPVGLVERS